MFEEKIKNLNYDKLGRMLGNAKKIVDDLREGKNEEYIICIFNKEYVYRDGDLFFNGSKVLEKQKWKIFSIIKELEKWLEFYHKCGVPEEECVCSDGDNYCKEDVVNWLHHNFPKQDIRLEKIEWSDYGVVAWVVNDTYVVAVKEEFDVFEEDTNGITKDDCLSHEENMVSEIRIYGLHYVLIYACKEVVNKYSFEHVFSYLKKKQTKKGENM